MREYNRVKKLVRVLKVFKLFVLLPYEISKGSKKRAYMRIKQSMISAKLL